MAYRMRWAGAWVLSLSALSSCASSDSGGTSTNPEAGAGSVNAGAGGAIGTAGAATGGPGTGGAPSSGGANATGGRAGSSSGGATTAGTGGAAGGTGGASAGPRQRACEGAVTMPDPLPANRTASLVKNGFGFLEGPVWIAERNMLFFSDMNFGGGDAAGPPSRIHSMTLTGGGETFAVFVDQAGSNGLALGNDGRILAATHDTQSLTYFDATSGARTNRPLLFEGHHFNSPNDLVVRADGNVYFTDPNYQLGSRASETGVEGLYRATPSGDVSSVDDSFDKVNGVTLSPDENTLYAAGRSGGIQAFSLSAGGVPGPKRLFAPGSSDGMTVDCAGNVYTTNGGVIVTDPDGKELGRISVPGPSNVAFGGQERKTLYITAGNSLYRIELLGPGMPY